MNIQEILTTLLTTVITAVLPVLVTYIIKFINKKSAELQAKTENAYGDATISAVEDLVTTIVVSLSQTVVETAKKEGTFTKEIAEEVFNTAKIQVMNALTSEAKDYICKMYNITIEQYVDNKIEEAVNKTKNTTITNITK